MVFLSFGYRPVKSGLLALKFTFFRKFVELTPAKTPIYITGTKVKCDGFYQLAVKIA